MANSTGEKLVTVMTAVINLDRAFSEKYILIGGASLVCQGSQRVTMDLDVLVPVECIDRVSFTLTQSQDVTHRAGVVYSRAGETEFPVDILHRIIGDRSFEDLDPFTITILGGIKTLNLPISLGIKIRCWFMRNDEVESGQRKQISDLHDIGFICIEMQKMNMVVDNTVAKVIPVGPYNMQLVKDALEQVGTLDLFLSVGGDKFLQHPWEEDSDDQWEYDMLLRGPGDDEEDQVGV